jgi:peptide/nickel transport system substrate-binding protein
MTLPRKRLLAIFTAFVLGGCTRTGESGTLGSSAAHQNAYTMPHTLRIGDIVDFDNLNPHLSASLLLGNLSQLTMAYLVRYDAHNRPTPELATEVPTKQNGGISKDGLTITWHLRRGVKWSDGAPFDADDVVFSTNAVNNSANNEVARDGWDLTTKVDKPDKYTVVFHLKKPYSGYLPTFFGSAGSNPCVLPKHLLASLPNFNQAPYNSKPVGIGPFRYVEWVRGDHITLEANPYYWRGEPKIRQVVYKIIPDRNTLLTQLQTGEIDMWTYVPPAYVGRAIALPNVNHFRGPSYLYMHLDFNTTRPALADRTVREALRLAIDRKLLIEKVNHGVGILQESPESSVSPWYTPLPLIPYDPAKANQLLNDDGWKRGPDGIRAKNGVRLSFDWATQTGSPDADARIEQIRSMWKPLGVAISVKHYNPALYFQVTGGIVYGGKWDLTAFYWQMTPDGDLNPFNSCTGIPPNGQNVTRFCDAKGIQPLLDAEKAAYGEGARKAIIAKATREINAQVPYEVLLLSEDVHVYNNDLTNWHPNNTTPFDDFMNVDI